MATTPEPQSNALTIQLKTDSARGLLEQADSPNLVDTPTFLSVFSQYPICAALCSHLNILGILTLSRISRTLKRNVSSLLKPTWDINRKLSRFVDDPIAFRAQMCQDEAIISGSFALQFFDGIIWQESDLDVYVGPSGGAVSFGNYLHTEEGYRLVGENGDADEYTEDEILKVLIEFPLHFLH